MIANPDRSPRVAPLHAHEGRKTGVELLARKDVPFHFLLLPAEDWHDTGLIGITAVLHPCAPDLTRSNL